MTVQHSWTCFPSNRWLGEQSGDQGTCHITDNQCHKIRYSKISLWGHSRWWPEVLWWDCDWPCCKRYSELPASLINVCKCVLGLENMWSQRYEIDLWQYDKDSSKCRIKKKRAIILPLKERPCSVIHTLDAVRWHRVVGRTNPLAYIWGCVVTRPAQLQRRVLGYKRKPLKLHLLWIAVLKKASTACFGGVFWHSPKIMYPSGPVNAISPVNQKQSGWHCFLKHHSQS